MFYLKYVFQTIINKSETVQCAGDRAPAGAGREAPPDRWRTAARAVDAGEAVRDGRPTVHRVRGRHRRQQHTA